MAVPKNKTDDAQLKNLVPLNTLSEEQLGQLLTRIVIEKARKGQYLFTEGDSDHQNIYLLGGTVALLSGQKEMDLVTSGTQTARFALAHQIPRKYSARAKSEVSYVRIDSRMLSDMLEHSQTASYEVDEDESTEKGDWMSQLLRSPVFQQIPPANLQRVMMRMEQVTVSKDETIIQQGDDGDYFYLISRGKCRITRQPEADHPPVELAQLKAGQGFGEEALISNKPRSSTVTMITDGELVRLSKKDFVELVKQPLSQAIDYPAACKLAEENALWIDVRIPEEYDAGHLPDAINLPYFSIRFQTSSLADDRIYLVYGTEVGQSTTAAYLLIERGYEVYVLQECWNDLSAKAGLDTASPEAQVNNVIDFNRDADPSDESKCLQSATDSQARAREALDLQNKLAAIKAQYETKASQFQTEKKILKQALGLAKRKLEIQEKNAEIAQQTHSEEVGRLRSALSEKEAVQRNNQSAQNDSDRLYQARIVDLEKQLEQLKHQFEKAAAAQEKQLRQEKERADTYSERNIYLEEKLQSAEAKFEQYQKRTTEAHDVLVKRRDEVQRDFHELQSTSAAREQEANDNISMLKRKLQETQATSERYTSDIESLKGERDRLRTEFEDYQGKSTKEIEQAVSERKRLNQQIEEFKAQSTALEEEVNILRQSSDSAGAEYQALIDNLRDELEQTQTANKELQQTQQELTSERDGIEANLKKALASANERAVSLEAQLEAAQWDASEKLRQALEKEQEQSVSLSALQEQLEKAETGKASITQALSESESMLKQRNEQQQQLYSQLEEALHNVDFFRRSLATAEEAIEISEDSLNESEDAFNELKGRFESLKLEHVDLQKTLEETKQYLNDKENSSEQTKQEFLDVREKLNQELSETKSELEKAKKDEADKASAYKTELEALQAENAKIEKEVTELKRRLQETTDEYEIASKDQQQSIKDLERKLSAAQEAHTEETNSRGQELDASRALQVAQAEIAQLNKTIEGLREVQLEMETQLADESEEEILKLRSTLELEVKKRRTAEDLAKQADVLKRERDVQETAVEMLGEDIDNLGQEKKRLEKERDEALSQAEHLKQEVQELRGVIQTHVEQSKGINADEGQEDSKALRAELEMVRQQASSDLEQLRSELAAAKAKLAGTGERDMDEATSLQAQRQEIDSVRQALQEKDHMLKLSQTQCRKLEDSIEDRDREVDQLKRNLEVLIRKTGGLSDFSETFNIDNHTQSLSATTHDTDYLDEFRVRAVSPDEKSANGSRLGRIFRKK